MLGKKTAIEWKTLSLGPSEVKETTTPSGNKIIPTLLDLTKVYSTEIFGLEDFSANPSTYLAFKKNDFSCYFTDCNTITVSNSGKMGAQLYYRVECAEANDGWDVVGKKTDLFCLPPRHKHILTLSAHLQEPTSQRERRRRTKSDMDTVFTIPISVWKSSTIEEGVPTKIENVNVCVILPMDISVFTKIKYNISVCEINKTVVHPFFM
jgi:hypothetical protein